MKQEHLAKALSEIEDDLVVEARQRRPKKRLLFNWPLIAAAALLAFTFLWRAWSQPVLVTQFQGQDITSVALDLGDLKNVPLPTKSGFSLSSNIRLNLQFNLRKTHLITATNGRITAWDEAGNILLEDGLSLEAKGTFNVDWMIDPTQTSPFHLILERDGKTSIIELTQVADDQWQIRKQNK